MQPHEITKRRHNEEAVPAPNRTNVSGTCHWMSSRQLSGNTSGDYDATTHSHVGTHARLHRSIDVEGQPIRERVVRKRDHAYALKCERESVRQAGRVQDRCNGDGPTSLHFWPRYGGRADA